jgi:hypothetical protein
VQALELALLGAQQLCDGAKAQLVYEKNTNKTDSLKIFLVTSFFKARVSATALLVVSNIIPTSNSLHNRKANF